jgi:hypothetical protein
MPVPGVVYLVSCSALGGSLAVSVIIAEVAIQCMMRRMML